MFGYFLLLLICIVVFVLIRAGGDAYQIAYKLLQTGQHHFEPERSERPEQAAVVEPPPRLYNKQPLQLPLP